jgi:hypothetical protein
VFRSSWKDTLAVVVCANKGKSPPPPHVPIAVKGFYSDDVFQAWLCSAVAPPQGWFSVDNVDRRAGLTPQCATAHDLLANSPNRAHPTTTAEHCLCVPIMTSSCPQGIKLTAWLVSAAAAAAAAADLIGWHGICRWQSSQA